MYYGDPMRKTFSLLFLFVWVAMGWRPIPALAQDQDLPTYEDVIFAINGWRFDNGMPLYAINYTLMEAARQQGEYQASIGEVGHEDAEGGYSEDRAMALGYGDGKIVYVTEIVYGGWNATVETALEWWKQSPSHNPYMLSTEYMEIGAWVAEDEDDTIYYTAVFGYVIDGSVGTGPFTGDATSTAMPTDVPASTLTPVSLTPTETETAVELEPSATPTEAAAVVLPTSTSQLSEEGGGDSSNVLLIVGFIIFGLLIAGGIGYLIWWGIQSGRKDRPDSESGGPAGDGESPFDDLPHQEQFQRLGRLGEKALASYNLEVLEIKPLQYVMNAAFEVEARPKDDPAAAAEYYTLRINAPEIHDKDAVRSEMVWLAAIRQETDLSVPTPQMTLNGERVTTVQDSGVPQARHCVLLGRASGKAYNEELNPQALTLVGEVMAQLHQRSEGFQPPLGFKRKKWDMAGLLGQFNNIPPVRILNGLTKGQLEVVDIAAGRVEQAMQQLGSERSVFGLIHADLQQKNYLFSKSQVSFTDFDSCGWGYYLYDIAVTFSGLLDREDYNSLADAFLSGYRRVRPLSPEHEALIEAFIGARLMTFVLVLVGYAEKALRSGDPAKQIERQFDILRQFLSS